MILRELFLKLGLDVDTQSFAKGELVASSIKVALGAIVQVAHKVVESVKGAIEYGDKLDEMAQSVGMSTQALQEFQYAASFAGVSAEEFNGAVMKLSRSMAAAKEGSEEATKAYSTLGVKVTDGHGKLRKTEDVLMDLEAAFKKLPDGPQKVALAMDVFGRSGAHLIPMLNGVNPSLAELRKEAENLGYVMGEDAIRASAELADNFDRLKATTAGLWRSALAPVLPTLNDIVKKFLAWRQENAALMRQTITKWIKTIIEVVKMLAVTIVGLYKGATFAIGMIVKAVQTLSTVLDNFAGAGWKWAIFAALAFAFSPMLAIGAAIAGVLLLLDDYRGYLAGEDSLIGRWKDAIGDWMKPKGDDPWFLAAIKAFLRFVRDAIKAIDELGEKLNGAKTNGERARAVYGAANKVQQGVGGAIADALPRPQYAKNMDARFEEARARGLGWWASAKYGVFGGELPGVSASESRPAPSMSYAPKVEVNVTAAPGQTNADLVNQIGEEVQSRLDRTWEEAGAALSSY